MFNKPPCSPPIHWLLLLRRKFHWCRSWASCIMCRSFDGLCIVSGSDKLRPRCDKLLAWTDLFVLVPIGRDGERLSPIRRVGWRGCCCIGCCCIRCCRIRCWCSCRARCIVGITWLILCSITNWRHTGQLLWDSSQVLMQSAWKMCCK